MAEAPPNPPIQSLQVLCPKDSPEKETDERGYIIKGPDQASKPTQTSKHTMEWVKLVDNAVEKMKTDGRDQDASEFLDLKAFVNESGEPEDYLSALMYIIGDKFVINDDEVNFPSWPIQG